MPSAEDAYFGFADEENGCLHVGFDGGCSTAIVRASARLCVLFAVCKIVLSTVSVSTSLGYSMLCVEFMVLLIGASAGHA